MMQRIFFSVLWLFAAGAAWADPVTAISTIVGWVNGLSAVGLALLQIGTGLAITAIQKAKARRAARRSSGIQTEITLDGGDNSESFVIGRYATAGSWVCPPLTRGSRNRTLTYVVDLGGMTGQQLVGLFIGSDKIEFDGAFDHGVARTSTGDTYADKVRLSYFDGSQTVAPALLLEHYSDHPDFPWTADMVGRGRCFAVVEFEFDDKLWTGTPTVLFELEGIPLLDPRTGATIYSDNLAVLAYNVLRGIEFEDGTRWGGDAEAEDLPLSVWSAAMNECDRQIDLAEGGSERQFRGGFEVHVDDHEPAEVLERLMDACGGDVAEEGGTWYIQVGAPALPSMFITDVDLIVEQSSEMDPFPGLASTVNGLTMRFPNPEMAWSVSEAERVLRTDLESKDGDRRLLESLNLDACPFPKQVQRVGQAYVEDSRRFLTHRLALPPDAAKLPPLATIAWTSEYNQYSGTLFQIEGKGVSPYDLLTSLQVRETDPSDHSWSTLDEQPTQGGLLAQTRPDLYVIDGVQVLPEVIRDSEGRPRRAAILVKGLDPELDGVEWRIQDYSTTIISRGVAMDTGEEMLLTEGVLPAQDYLVGLRAVGGGLVDWSGWYAVRTFDIGLGEDDLGPDIWDRIAEDAQRAYDRFNGNFNLAFDRLAEIDLDTRVSEALETARVEGVVEEQRVELTAEVDGVKADLTQNYVTAASQTSALAQLQTTLSSQIGDVSADLSQNYVTLATHNSAIAALNTSLTAQINNVSANLSQNYYTSAGVDNAISAATQTFDTQLGGMSASIQTVTASIDGVKAVHGVKINNNGAISGFGLNSDLVDGNPVSDFLVDADNFRVGKSNNAGDYISPFQVIGNVTYIKEAVVKDGSFTTLKLAGYSVTVPVFVSGSLLTGNGGLQAGAVGVINLPQTGDIIIHWAVEQGYSDLGKTWGFRILANGVPIATRTGMTFGNDYPSGFVPLLNVSGSQTITFEWQGSDSGITGRPSMFLLGRMR
ncbi:MAG: phage tail tip fiber protein [Cognatishimia sp.]